MIKIYLMSVEQISTILFISLGCSKCSVMWQVELDVASERFLAIEDNVRHRGTVHVPTIACILFLTSGWFIYVASVVGCGKWNWMWQVNVSWL